MDHSVRSGRTAAQSVEVFNSTSMHLGTSGDVRASKPGHLMVPSISSFTNVRTDKAGSTGDENTLTISFAAVGSCFEGPPVVEVGNEPGRLCWAPSQPFLR